MIMIFRDRIKNFVFIVFGLLTISNILAWMAVYDLNGSKFLEVNFFDVGQGDAIFIETPKFHQILIDGGPGSAILEKLSREMPFWDRNIDLIILTHPEKDHLAGLLEVLKRYKVENILWTGVIRDTAEYKEWQRLIENEKADIKIAEAGQKILLISNLNNRMEILYPFENLQGQELKDSNNTSIVARLTFGENSFLFTGDIYKSVERKLIDQKIDINSDILKVSHHGSKTSTSEEFIAEVSPKIAVISVGKNNSYGHPRPEVLETLAKYGIRTLDEMHSGTLNTSYLKILRTDKDGDIKIISNGENLRTELPRVTRNRLKQ